MACSAAEPEHARNNDVAAKLQPSPRLSYYGTLGASVSGFQKPSSSCRMALMPPSLSSSSSPSAPASSAESLRRAPVPPAGRDYLGAVAGDLRLGLRAQLVQLARPDQEQQAYPPLAREGGQAGRDQGKMHYEGV